ncbi:dUTP diphosphatase [Bacillus tianshenii]|nr:dUTP diphosphatase [Bacillus tianshenii]
MISLKKLFDMQRTLDARIKEEHQLHNRTLFEEKVLALFVELGELANETRCFKFWSKKPSAPEDIVLEEYVDGLHFILSIGIELGFEDKVVAEQPFKETTLVEQFQQLYAVIQEIREKKDVESYQQVMTEFFILGKLLGFSVEQIELAYDAKNEVNHERQDSGY